MILTRGDMISEIARGLDQAIAMATECDQALLQWHGAGREEIAEFAERRESILQEWKDLQLKLFVAEVLDSTWVASPKWIQ